ncbi:MAG TPA: exodeoxyribonuclease VII large subunit, partial [Micropruina sp.]|nr:exodeoxyribonuclease VII large subunit [Micropruina sp.]
AATPTDAAKRIVPEVADECDRVHQARDRARASLLRLLDREQQGLAALRSRPVLADPLGPVTVAATQVTELGARGRRSIQLRVREELSWVEHTVSRARALSPRATLLRGYAIMTTGDGSPVDSTRAIAAGQDVIGMLADGTVTARITGVQPREEPDD